MAKKHKISREGEDMEDKDENISRKELEDIIKENEKHFKVNYEKISRLEKEAENCKYHIKHLNELIEGILEIFDLKSVTEDNLTTMNDVDHAKFTQLIETLIKKVQASEKRVAELEEWKKKVENTLLSA